MNKPNSCKCSPWIQRCAHLQAHTAPSLQDPATQTGVPHTSMTSRNSQKRREPRQSSYSDIQAHPHPVHGASNALARFSLATRLSLDGANITSYGVLFVRPSGAKWRRDVESGQGEMMMRWAYRTLRIVSAVPHLSLQNSGILYLVTKHITLCCICILFQRTERARSGALCRRLPLSSLKSKERGPGLSLEC